MDCLKDVTGSFKLAFEVGFTVVSSREEGVSRVRCGDLESLWGNYGLMLWDNFLLHFLLAVRSENSFSDICVFFSMDHFEGICYRP